MRKRTLALAAVVVAALTAVVVAAYLLDPDGRLEAAVRGRPTFLGRSATAWARDLGTADDVERSLVFGRLKGGKSDAVPVLAWVLRAADKPEARWHAADVLGQLGADGRPAAGDLIAALGDADPLVQATAQKSLGKLAPAAADALPPELGGVVAALQARFPDTVAIRAASDYKRHAASAVPALTQLLTHADPAVRWNAARALGKVGDASKPAAAAIVAQMADPVALVREHAAEALGDIGPAVAETVPDLAKCLADPDWKVRRDAVRSLGQMGPAAKRVLPQVLAMAGDAQAEVREAAATAGRKIDPASAREPKP